MSECVNTDESYDSGDFEVIPRLTLTKGNKTFPKNKEILKNAQNQFTVPPALPIFGYGNFYNAMTNITGNQVQHLVCDINDMFDMVLPFKMNVEITYRVFGSYTSSYHYTYIACAFSPSPTLTTSLSLAYVSSGYQYYQPVVTKDPLYPIICYSESNSGIPQFWDFHNFDEDTMRYAKESSGRYFHLWAVLTDSGITSSTPLVASLSAKLTASLGAETSRLINETGTYYSSSNTFGHVCLDVAVPIVPVVNVGYVTADPVHVKLVDASDMPITTTVDGSRNLLDVTSSGGGISSEVKIIDSAGHTLQLTPSGSAFVVNVSK